MVAPTPQMTDVRALDLPSLFPYVPCLLNTLLAMWTASVHAQMITFRVTALSKRQGKCSLYSTEFSCGDSPSFPGQNAPFGINQGSVSAGPLPSLAPLLP